MRGQFVEGAGALARMLDSGEIECCASHGDLQPGNVLLGKGGGVTVIDWERTIPRAAWFDPLTFSLEARKGLGLAERVERFIAEGPDIRAARLLGDLTRDAAGREGRRRMLAVHLLEQMEYYLSEQVMSRFTRPGPGLSALMAEWKDLVSSFI
jgi:hypothetical protein